MTDQPPSAASVTLQSLSKAFGDRQVLEELSLGIEPGEFVAVVGKSGCGKSTLLRLVAGLEVPTGGTVQVDGKPVRGVVGNAARLMFQDARLLPWKRVHENVALGLPPGLPRARLRQMTDNALAQVGLPDRSGDWPALLSGGQRQRVALARALAAAPPLLLLDEPLGALDALTRAEMQDLLADLWREQGFTALLVTHDVEEALLLADRVLLIDNGTVTLNLPVLLPRPRHRGSAELAALKETLLTALLGAGA
ncbi:MAG: ABC transporter ATP-binding protein [Cytophagales bacterium]|nr:ABC transporter ATP-binding protein [Armatimonadota bacterium]